ncbi:MAG TPA: 2OG-Fe(II) oxygenase [Allosphingosinicella sp.]|nr:2OG-Fe(II) oxygenase [Allosphingosinicella sp.]
MGADGEDAQTELALRLLSEGKAEEGARLLGEACEAGSAVAAERLAVLEAMGAGRPQSWSRAFAFLDLAAGRGSGSARSQLELLARGGAGIDLAALLAPPAKRSLADAPRIRAIAGFATAEECDWVIGLAGDKLQPARVWDPVTGENRSDPSRTNHAMDLGLGDTDVIVEVLRARIAATSNLPVPVFETPQVMRYAVGQAFHPHYDYLDPNEPGDRAQLQRRGQRIATFLLYLNDDFEGGETAFPAIGLSHRGRKGDGLLFANVDDRGAPEPKALHAGTPPTRGEKWILSQWVRDRTPAAE